MKEIDHASRAHARLSASGSSRWINCTPSAALEDNFENKTSSFAEEGTLAHELSEYMLTRQTVARRDLAVEKAKYEELTASKYYSKDMEGYINDYVAFVLERLYTARGQDAEADILLEQRFDLSEWVPESFGTGDVTIVSNEVLEIIDLKYGKGKKVEAEGNTQMRLYALGAYNEYSMLYDFKEVRMTIYQPRIDNISTEVLPLQDLLDWGEWVKPVAAKAYKGEGTYKPGEHCGFCRAKNECRARAEFHLSLAEKEFQNPDLLTVEEIAEILHQAPMLASWASDVKDHALKQAEQHGVRYPGWKLVEGRSNRIISNKPEAIDRLDMLYGDEVFKPRELVGLTDLQKIMGKKNFEETLNDIIIKPAGKPTLVTEDDKRQEISSFGSAQADFAE